MYSYKHLKKKEINKLENKSTIERINKSNSSLWKTSKIDKTNTRLFMTKIKVERAKVTTIRSEKGILLHREKTKECSTDTCKCKCKWTLKHEAAQNNPGTKVNNYMIPLGNLMRGARTQSAGCL